MREPNLSSPAQHRAAAVISSTMYDRRALDCTATLPLVNSLTHLVYMTSTSPRIRETLASDGGLERLVRILASCQHVDRRSLWKWSLAFQCVVNVGVRGTEAIRTRVIAAGAIHVVLAILENFLSSLAQAKLEHEPHESTRTSELATTATAMVSATPPISLQTTAQPPVAPAQSRSTPVTMTARYRCTHDPELTSPTVASASTTPAATQPQRRRTFLTRSPSRKPPAAPAASLSSIPLLTNLPQDSVLHREEDILLSLQLLAYLSKYPHLRHSLHTAHRRNVFAVVEKFTHRLHPPAIIYWAGVIMRNACRKDETQGGLRQCAYMHCGKWERYPREFAKCRRCRKAKYCSKTCQSKAWGEGHRWWCVERTHSTAPEITIPPAASTAAQADERDRDRDHAPAPTAAPEGLPITIDDPQSNMQVDAAETAELSSSPPVGDRPRRSSRLFYRHRRRNSRESQTSPSGSSTEVEPETDTLQHDRAAQDLMDVD